MSETDRLRAAFLYHHTQEVMMADQRLHKQEVGLLEGLNPEMIRVGLMDPDGTLRDDYEAAWETADLTLKSSLDEPARRALLDRLLQVMAVDGDLDPKEWKALARAAQLLDLPPP